MSDSKKLNFVLIVMDAVRSNHLSCYGYKKRTTPNIDKLSKKGILFKNAFSTCGWTPTSLASLFTGKYPSHHGVLSPNLYMSQNNTLLTEILQSHGYETFGANIPVQVNKSRGYKRGWNFFWESYEDGYSKKFFPFLRYTAEILQRSWKDLLDLEALTFNFHSFIHTLKYNFHSFYVNKIVKKWMENRDRERPFFLFVQYEDAHFPYIPLLSFERVFEEEIDSSNFELEKLNYIAQHKGGYGYIAKEIDISETEFEILKSWYDAEISYVDFRLKEILDLFQTNVGEDTVIIITSDHGENFGEHNLAYHQYCLYDTLIHVPLIIYDSRSEKEKKIYNLVSLVDLFPTVLELANIDYSDGIDGKSVASFEEKRYHEQIFAEDGRPDLRIFKEKYPGFDCSVLDREIKCVRTLKFKYIIDSNGHEELYNIEEDPDEKINIAQFYPNIAESLKEEMNKNLLRFGKTKKLAYRKIDERKKIIRRLQELGYL